MAIRHKSMMHYPLGRHSSKISYNIKFAGSDAHEQR